MLWLVAADIRADAIRCDSCRPAVMVAAAKDAGLGHHHVYSIATREVRSYDVVAAVNGVAARPVPTPHHITLCVAGLSEIYISSDGTMQMEVDVPYESLGLKAIDQRGADALQDTLLLDLLIPARLSAGDIETATVGVNTLLSYAYALPGLRQGTRLTWIVALPAGITVTYDHLIGHSLERRRHHAEGR